MSGYLSLLFFLFSTYLFTHFFRPHNRIDFIITFFCLTTAQIIVSANTLSYFEKLHSSGNWTVASLSFLLLSVLLTLYRKRNNKFSNSTLHFRKGFQFNKQWIASFSTFEKFVFIPLISSVLIIGLVNLFFVFNLAPGNHDSMTFHLARVAYYLQHGRYDFYEANYWAQVVHPRNSTSLFLYSYVVTGKENFTQLIQYISYWITIISIFGISIKSGMSKKPSLFSALIGGLLISVLMQATTTQTDLILTAFIGSIVYYFFAFKRNGRKQYLILATMAVALSIGIKASIILALIPVAFIAIWSFYRNNGILKTQIKHYLLTGIAFLISFIFFTLPSGYLTNIQKFGHPLGPDLVRISHTFESESPEYIVKNGARNSLRYAVEFASLDGLPKITPIRKVQKLIRGYSQSHFEEFVTLPEIDDDEENLTENTSTIKYTGDRFLINYLMEPTATRALFNYFKMPATNDSFSYWGIFGFTLIWPLLFYSLFSKKSPSSLKILAIAAIVFFVLQAFSGPYDPWRGRYFNIAAIFATPSIGLILQTNFKFLKGYLLIIITLGCLSAFSGILLKSGDITVADTGDSLSIRGYTFEFLFTKNRIAQLTGLGPYYEPVEAFDTLVPSDASVAVYLPGDSHEYPLFGKNLTRTIYPINSFINGVQPIPDDADYLLYSEGYPGKDLKNDILLGRVLNSGWYLRPLK